MATDCTPHPLTLTERLDRALALGGTADLDRLAEVEPLDRFDATNALLGIYDLWNAPVQRMDGRERYQNHPGVAALKWRLEEQFLARLDRWASVSGPSPADAGAALRRLARRDNDDIYDWLATTADEDQLRCFLALEGGPDAGFDDLVAVCQVGLTGGPKVAMGANYWDEMGRGQLAEVHAVLHDRMTGALDLPRIPRSRLPQSSLDRTALNGLLVTNRWLQPELIGALGLIELQAGPRCRKVVHALTRLGAPADALPFYEEHANADPRHAKEWLDGVVGPLVAAHPSWGRRIVRGATWRAEASHRLFARAMCLLKAEPVARSEMA